MNNTKRKFLAGVIAAVVCFTMIMGSFGAIIGAVFGLISNQDLIDAINNGSISVGDLALLASLNAGNLTIDGQDVTNVAADGYHAKNNLDEIDDKKDDYDTYNKPYYTAGVTSTSTTATIGGTAYTVKYAPASSYFSSDLANNGVSGNLAVYCDISMRHAVSANTSGESVIVVKENANLVIAMATPEEILDQTAANIGRIQLNSAVFKDGLLGGKTVYGICLNRCYFELKAGASLTLLGRDFNGNGYIDDVPVEITVNGAKYWFYEKIVLSGSSAYQDYDPVIITKTADLRGGHEVFDAKDGITRPLISVYGGTDGSTTSAKLIISGADLRNNFNEKIPNVSGIDPGDVDDVVTGGGAIYLASGSASGAGRNSTTGGWFKEVIITNTRFSYCGAVRGGAIMVGKNFYSSTLDLSYCDYDHCYTAYYNYNSPDTNQGSGESDQSGDGGAVCFYQDDTTTEDWYATKNHNNPSLIYAGTVDFTGSTFSFCYAMRAGGAIHFGGYHYNKSDLTANSAGHVTNPSGFTDRLDMLGTRIDTLKIDFCDFYCCGAGWVMKDAPGISDSDFIFTSKVTVSQVPAGDLFAGIEGITDYVTAKNPGTDNLFTEINPWGDSYPGLQDLQWLRLYDDEAQVAKLNNSAPRNLHNWYNIPQMKFAGACREGGAIFFNCRVGEMSMKDCTFIYCAADSNGGAVFLDDRFVCPSAIVENCLFKNNMSNESTGGGSDTGTFRSTGLAAADIHFNNCSFLYNLNFGGGGALYLNLNNTYTSPYAGNTTYNVAKPENDPTTQRNKDRCAGSEVNNCLFFGNFAIWSGAAIRCTGVMDINSSTFAHNISNNGYAGAIYFLTYERPLVDVGTEKAQMRFDIQYGDDFDGHTIVCYNEVGGTTSGGGGIAISATHSPSVGIPDTTVKSTDSAKTYTSRQYSFDFALNGVLVFNNTAAGGGGGIYFRVNNDAAPSGSVVNAWVYDKNVNLNNGYVFDNYAYGVGGGVRVRDDCSVRDGATKVTISGANVYDNESVVDGGGLYILAEGGIVNIEGGYVVANKAPDGAGIYIKDTNTVNITGGNVGISKYGAPTLTRGATDTTFTAAASATLAGGNVATGNGGGICIENAFTEETYFDNDTTVTMAGGIIEANKAGTGGGLYMVRGSVTNAGIVNFTMNQSSDNSAYGFYGNTAANGAGIYASSNNATAAAQRYVVNLNGGEVAANVATTNGGGAFITGGAQLVVNGGIMDSNKANTQNGGAVYINTDGAEAVISNGQISNNYAAQHGGGIQAYDANLTVSGGNITKNESGIAGGGLAIRGSAWLTMDGGTVSANTSVSGGGVFVSGATAKAEINGGTIGAGNNATTNGGGIYANDSATVTMKGGKVDGNTAAQNGGGIYVTTTENFTMNGGAISNNTATNGNGGGLCVEHTYLSPADGNTTLNVSWWGSMSATKFTQAEVDGMEEAFYDYLDALGYDSEAITLNIVKNPGTVVAKAVDNVVNDGTYHVILDGGNNMNTQAGETTGVKLTFADTVWLTEGNYTAESRRIGILSGKETTLARLFFDMLKNNYSASTVTNPAEISSATLESGNITGNKALKGYGGGVCCDSSIVDLTAKKDNSSYPVIQSNTAKNGGGVAVIAGGDVTMQGGYVTGNSAKCVTANYVTNNNTSYQRHTDLEGVGGGIYVANELGSSAGDARFSIVKYDEIYSGIYLNNAEFAADDVFANAVNTELSVPAFASMKIIGNAGKVTGWYEDYATGDVNYTIGLNGNKQDKNKYPIERYDKSPSDKVFEAWIDAADETADTASTISTPTKYINGSDFVCVTLGAYIIYDGKLTIEKYIPDAAHLDPEQTFIFHVVRTYDSDGNALPAGSSEAVNLYVTINVTDTSTRKNSVTITSLPLGTYKVTEMTEWSWRYEVDATNTTVKASNNGTANDSDSADEIVCTKLEMISGSEKSNDPTITFANELATDKWLDGNSPKVVNSLKPSSEIDISYVGGSNKATNVVLYANFKREETLI